MSIDYHKKCRIIGRHLFSDSFEELADSSLILVSYNKKSGIGLERGMSPTFDRLVDRYIETADLENPNMVLSYVKAGTIALWVIISKEKYFIEVM